MLRGASRTIAAEPLLEEFQTTASGLRSNWQLARFVFVQGGLMRDPVLFITIGASLCRSAMIFSINNAVSNPGFHPLTVLLLASSVVASLSFSHWAHLRTHAMIVSLQRNMRNALSRRLLQANASFLQGRDHGKIYSIMTSEAYQVCGAAATVLHLVEAALLLLICVPYLFWVSWPIGVAAVFAVAVGGIGFTLSEAPARLLVIQLNEASAAFCSRVNDMLGGWMELRLRRARHDALEADITSITDSILNYSLESERHFTRASTITQASLTTLLCGIVVMFPYLQGEGGTTIMQMMTVLLLAYGPIGTIFSGLPSLTRAVTSQQRISRIVHELSEAREPMTAAQPPRPAGFRRIELRGVVATVSDAPAENGLSGKGAGNGAAGESFRLGPIDLVLEPGQIVFICGGNGAGKSTLLAILTGLRAPDEGTILVDDVPVTPENRAQYRELFSAVFSQFHLFRKAYGLTEGERRRVGDLIEVFGLDDRVRLAENQFSTLSLSTGQKRRLALAVARAEERPVIVLDEFAADQDPVRRAYFYDVLVPEIAAAGNLVLAVTHDEHAFNKCDRLIKLEAGRIVADLRVDRRANAEARPSLTSFPALPGQAQASGQRVRDGLVA